MFGKFKFTDYSVIGETSFRDNSEMVVPPKKSSINKKLKLSSLRRSLEEYLPLFLHKFEVNLFFNELNKEKVFLTGDLGPSPGGGVLPYVRYMGMCRCEGYGFQAV